MLYELLTGQRAFKGDTAADTMTAILKEAPADLSSGGRLIPAGLARVVERCLEKEPGARFQSASDLAFALRSANDSAAGSGEARAIATSAPTSQARWVFAAAGLVAGAGLGALIVAQLAQADSPSNVATDAGAMTFSLSLPDGVSVHLGSNPTRAGGIAVSPDGRAIVFAGRVNDGSALYLRTLDDPVIRRIPDSDAAVLPFWSADSRRVALFSGSQLKSVVIEGGPVEAMTDARPGPGCALMRSRFDWRADGPNAWLLQLQRRSRRSLPGKCRTDDGRRQHLGLGLFRIGRPGREPALPATKEGPLPLSFSDWSPDGKFLLGNQGAINNMDVVAWPLDGSAPINVTAEPGRQQWGAFDPTGKWVAYNANDGGPDRVFVTSFPTQGARIAVSAIPGSNPRWRRDGRELFYISLTGEIVAVPVSWPAAGPPTFGGAQVLFRIPRLVNANMDFDVTPDGQTFVAIVEGEPDRTPLMVSLRRWSTRKRSASRTSAATFRHNRRGWYDVADDASLVPQMIS